VKDDRLSTTIGLINVINDVLRGMIDMPADALGPVLQTLIAGKLHYFDFRGEPLRYRKALLWSYRL